MIPRRIFWLIDTLIVVVAFSLAYLLTPVVSQWAYPNAEALGVRVPGLLPLVAHERGSLPEIGELTWILIAIIPAVLFTLDANRAYGQLRYISRTRLALCGSVAMAVALSAAALLIF